MRTSFFITVFASFCLHFAGFVPAQSPVKSVKMPQKSENRDSRQNRQTAAVPAMQLEMRESLKKLPWDQLSTLDKLKIKKIVTQQPMFRKMPTQTVYADPEVYNFMLQNPEAVIAFWQYLGATQLSLQKTKTGKYELRETAGTEAVVEILHRSKDLCIVYAKGEYSGQFLAKPCTGEVLLFLRSKTMRDQSGELMIACDLDTMISMDSLGIDMIAKMFYSSLGKIADDNFAQTVAFISHFSKTAVNQTDGLKLTLRRVPTIQRDTVDDLCDVIDRTAMRAIKRRVDDQVVTRVRQELPAPGQRGYLDRQMESHNAVFDSDPFFSSDFEAVKSTVNDRKTVRVEDVPSEDEAPVLPKPRASKIMTVSPDEELDFDNLLLE